jgi:2-enoate reductase
MKLFEAGKIGNLTLKNRIAMASMGCGGLIQPDGRLSQRGIDYYVARAKGGIGLIISSSVQVSRELEYLPIRPLVPYLVIDNRKVCSAWVDELADAVHDYGAKIAVQLAAGLGRVLSRQDLMDRGTRVPIAPSPVPCFYDQNLMTRELTVEEIRRLIKNFIVAATILRESGIDAVELNAHGGYLIDQFLTPCWNRRTDQYGGSLEGRLRFLLEVVEGIKRACGSDLPIIVKYGLTHYLEGGREVEEGLEIARRLEGAGVDALCIDAGSYETPYWFIPSEFQSPLCVAPLSEMTKKVVKIPVITVGKAGYPELAERALQEGKADFIALGRALLADPEWAVKVKEGREKDIRPCIGCLEGCRRRIHDGKSISCTVNPTTGKERELTIQPAEKRRSVLIVGGGPGGMEAARVAALKGHRVTLWERRDALGGNLIPASQPAFKRDYRILIRYLSTQVRKLGVDVKLGKEDTGHEAIQRLKPDVVFIATGSIPIIPEIPGVKKEHVMTANDLLLGKKETGETVVIIGGGIIGCETALFLAQEGKKVTIIEILEDIARDMYSVNRMHLLKLLANGGVKILTRTRVVEIRDQEITIVDKEDRPNTLKADTVVLALGLKPNSEPYESLVGKVPEVYPIGDCTKARKVINAVWEGFRLARLI